MIQAAHALHPPQPHQRRALWCQPLGRRERPLQYLLAIFFLVAVFFFATAFFFDAAFLVTAFFATFLAEAFLEAAFLVTRFLRTLNGKEGSSCGFELSSSAMAQLYLHEECPLTTAERTKAVRDV